MNATSLHQQGGLAMELGELTYRIRGCVYEVYRQLEHGFLEKVYENALMHELGLQGIQACRQQPLEVHYKGAPVGEFVADIVVENQVVIELKAQQKLPTNNESQLLNYLRAGGFKIGLLVNFTYPKAEIKRLVL